LPNKKNIKVDKRKLKCYNKNNMTGDNMKKIIFVLIMFCFLISCGEISSDKRFYENEGNFNTIRTFCYDGQEYIQFGVFDGRSIVNHLDPDGKPVKCKSFK